MGIFKDKVGKTYEGKHRAFNFKVIIFAIVIIFGSGFLGNYVAVLLMNPYMVASLSDVYSIKDQERLQVEDEVMPRKFYTLEKYEYTLADSNVINAIVVGTVVFCSLCVAAIMMLYKSNNIDTHLSGLGTNSKNVMVEIIKEDVERDKIRAERDEKNWEDFAKWKREQKAQIKKIG